MIVEQVFANPDNAFTLQLDYTDYARPFICCNSQEYKT